MTDKKKWATVMCCERREQPYFLVLCEGKGMAERDRVAKYLKLDGEAIKSLLTSFFYDAAIKPSAIFHSIKPL